MDRGTGSDQAGLVCVFASRSSLCGSRTTVTAACQPRPCWHHRGSTCHSNPGFLLHAALRKSKKRDNHFTYLAKNSQSISVQYLAFEQSIGHQRCPCAATCFCACQQQGVPFSQLVPTALPSAGMPGGPPVGPALPGTLTWVHDNRSEKCGKKLLWPNGSGKTQTLGQIGPWGVAVVKRHLDG